MEFRFDINEFIKNEFTKIDKHLLPDSFSGDRRAAGRCTTYVSEIIDEMGMASAKAQALLKPITSAEKLRNSEYIVYLLVEPDANNGNGSVVGLLKMGWKNLYVFDERGMTHENMSLCVLDFYVYESSQRKGYGKKLFDYMLQDEGVEARQLAVDKPSQKFISFLYKHYGLEKIIPQSNNFVIYAGFFAPRDAGTTTANGSGEEYIASTNSTRAYVSESQRSFTNQHSIKEDEYGLSMYGRHAAYKPVSTIGKIVQSSKTGTLECSKRSGL